MFELIKKWFKRPIVINFTVEPLSSGTAINVVKTDTHLTPEAIEAFRKAWTHSSKAIVLGPGITLEQLSDADLHAIGLIRGGIAHGSIHNIPKEGTYLLPKGERVVPNSGITKYLSRDEFQGSR